MRIPGHGLVTMVEFMEPGFSTWNFIVCSFIIIGLVALASRYRILDKSGVMAAVVLACVVGFLGHWSWLLVLLSFLIASHKATKWRFEEKTAMGLNESGDGHRSWTNVIANGGLPGLVVILAFLEGDWENGVWLFTASVAVAASDTFASEIGCMDKRVRMITTFKKCEPGTNGGFSPNGQLAAALGAFTMGMMALVLYWLPSGHFVGDGFTYAMIAALIGWIGCQIDSLLGALLENRGFMTKGTVNAASITIGVILMYFILDLSWY